MSKLNKDNLIGRRFGKWVVVGEIKHPVFKYRSKWVCKCDCGEEKIYISSHLINGKSKSCGCARMDYHTSHGMSNTKMYRKWAGMKRRCENESDSHYEDYGGRGIRICDEWKTSFEKFRDWAINNGYSDDLEIDRIDNNKGYYPENCRFVNKTINCNNRRSTRIIEIDGIKKPLMEWVRETGLSRGAIYGRMNKGISGKELIQPLMKPGPKGEINHDSH